MSWGSTVLALSDNAVSLSQALFDAASHLSRIISVLTSEHGCVFGLLTYPTPLALFRSLDLVFPCGMSVTLSQDGQGCGDISRKDVEMGHIPLVKPQLWFGS